MIIHAKRLRLAGARVLSKLASSRLHLMISIGLFGVLALVLYVIPKNETSSQNSRLEVDQASSAVLGAVSEAVPSSTPSSNKNIPSQIPSAHTANTSPESDANENQSSSGDDSDSNEPSSSPEDAPVPTPTASPEANPTPTPTPTPSPEPSPTPFLGFTVYPTGTNSISIGSRARLENAFTISYAGADSYELSVWLWNGGFVFSPTSGSLSPGQSVNISLETYGAPTGVTNGTATFTNPVTGATLEVSLHITVY